MSLLETLYQRFEAKTASFLASSNWKSKIVIVAVGIMLLSFFNNYSPLRHFGDYYTAVVKEKREYFLYQTIKDRAASITYNWTYPEFTGMNNRTFRLAMPAFVKVFHIQHVSVVLYAIQLILGIVFLYMLVNFFERTIQDKSSIFYAVVGIISTYIGSSFFIDNASYGDFFGYFCLFLAIYYRNPLLIFIFISLAFWGDERAGVGSTLVLLWWWFVPQWNENKAFKIQVNLQMLAVVASWIAYGVVRKFYLIDTLGMHHTTKPGEFAEMFGGSWPVWGFKFLWVFEGWWILILLAFVFMAIAKDWLRLLAILGALMAMLVGSLTTFDSTRSGSYGIIAIFLALVFAQKHLTEKELKILLLLIAIICFLHPMATRTDGTGFFLM
ncbi:hypothetical protein Emtol_2351 [Emticicia oligotrophica DSM 17448]|jgi:hypothetical protein|uniref:Uncharacterized protein n=1 Tax=Emticicia oligotrophica (strain DSM 17448 / CIP 109782 / MTCC 6937 / GPTSA100-15) TaxID=929562 RepID=A0ABM5N226_EMTOG|nr:hypothetical protein [Emticicia oligotrophica]AFK03488.1 hypothetical protein Emtol_2351 [Emticicia oligotrophica DSM 17448]